MRIRCSMNMRNLSPEQVLVKCPQCGAWPMSLAPRDDVATFGQLTFKCMKCRRLEVYRIGVGGTLISAPAERR
jgi:DNA-directed RNA polymerase subunit RPC12/RpoP